MLRSPSPDALARHLLRHCLDPRQLQRNELAAAFVRTLPRTDTALTRQDKILRWIHAGVEALGAGHEQKAGLQAEIIRSCDLLGKTHLGVWTELGLSRRAFYNERRAALTRLAIILSARLPQTVVTASTAFDAFELRLASMHLFESSGHFDLAVHESESLMRSAANPEERTRALAAVMEACLLSGRLDGARGRLSQLEAQLDNLGTASAQGVAAAIAGATACAAARWNFGDAPQALAHFANAERTIRAHPTAIEDGRVAGAWIESRLQFADFNAIAGQVAAALVATREASELLDRWNDGQGAARARLLTIQAFIVLTLDRPLGEAAALAREALAVAHRYGLLSNAVEAATTLCLVQAVSGDCKAALRTGHSALALADRFPAHQAGVFLRLVLARIHAHDGNTRQSHPLLNAASQAIQTESALGVFRDTTAASVALSRGAFGLALRHSREAADAAQRSGFGRTIGGAFAQQARALHALGRPRIAATLADAAVAVLERGGARYTLAEAYELSGRLTSNPRHAKLARELRAILRAPA